jgi:hypothetical protein
LRCRTRARKDIEFLEFEDEIRGFLREGDRIQFRERLVTFFQENLAPRPSAGAP